MSRIALTFDDGPGPHTERLLDLLAARAVRATFLLVGENVVSRPELVRRMVLEGHEIGNHTWDHPDLRELDDAAVGEQVRRTTAAVLDAVGVRPRFVRPPYGGLDERVRGALGALGAPILLWQVDSLDWTGATADAIVARVLAEVDDGAIVLLHDVQPHTVAAVPDLLDALGALGHDLVTASELLGDAVLAGVVHRRA